MSRVTSKLQVTVPKTIAVQYEIRPGDDLDWIPAGDAVRVRKMERRPKTRAARAVAPRLSLFDAATERQTKRQKGTKRATPGGRGWKREDLYGRGLAR